MANTSCAVIHTAPSVAAMLPLPAVGPRTRTTLLLVGSIAVASSIPVRTHTASAPTATSPPRMGPADTRTVATTVSVSGSIRDTVPSFWFITHTASWPTVMNREPDPVATVARVLPSAGSTRTTDSLDVVTHSDPKPPRSAWAARDAGKVPRTVSVAGSIDSSRRLFAYGPATSPQTASSVTANDDSGRSPGDGTGMRACAAPSRTSMRTTVPIATPDCSPAQSESK